MTYEAWVQAFSFPGASGTFLFDSFASVKFATTGEPTFSVTNDKDYFTGGTLPTDEWLHLSFVFRYSGSNGEAVYFINAKEQSRTSAAYSSTQSGKNYLYIGYRTAAANTDAWNGYIQHFRVWN